MSDDEAFVALVRRELVGLGCHVDHADPTEAHVTGRLSGTVALTSVRQSCAPLPRAQWPRVITEHLQGLAEAAALRLDLSAPDPVRHLLRTRLYDEAGPEAELLAGRLLAPGLYEALVVDQPRSVHGVPAAQAAGWGEPLPDLLAQGRAHVLDDGLLLRREVDLGGASALLLEDVSPYTTTHLAWLPSYLDVPAGGALVAVPTRHCLLAYPLTDRDGAVVALQGLLLNAQRLYDEGPGSVSPHLYWWHDSVLTLLPGTVGDGRIELRPPEAFVDVLDSLHDGGAL